MRYVNRILQNCPIINHYPDMIIEATEMILKKNRLF